MKTVEDGWREIEANNDFCCDAHRKAFRGMYFAGAMNALSLMTSWDPRQPAGLVMIDIGVIDAVCRKLKAVYEANEIAIAQGEAVSAGVRH